MDDSIIAEAVPPIPSSSLERTTWDTNVVSLIEHHFGLIDAVAAAKWYKEVLAYGQEKEYRHPLFE
jgi:hypothetical protein